MFQHEESLLAALRQQPDDGALGQIYADWLEERGDARAELWRLRRTLTQAVDVSDRAALEERLRCLLATGVRPPGPLFTNSLGMPCAWIASGTFLMGSPANEEWRTADEVQHRVTLTKGFWMGVHQVTQKQWRAVMGSTPSRSKGQKLPVEQVSWDDCQEFCRKLTGLDGKPYRLPTEAEWEYACRAGTTTPFYFGATISTDQANYNGNHTNGGCRKGVYRAKTTAVGSFPPNAWGLFDMHGNVWEWCQDCYVPHPEECVKDLELENDNARPLRGGSWYCGPMACRAAHRIGEAPGDRPREGGFRVCFCLD